MAEYTVTMVRSPKHHGRRTQATAMAGVRHLVGVGEKSRRPGRGWQPGPGQRRTPLVAGGARNVGKLKPTVFHSTLTTE